MIVQLSSGQGPSECELAVLKLYEALKKEYPDIEFLSAHEAREKGCYTSIIFTHIYKPVFPLMIRSKWTSAYPLNASFQI